jgi:hypothetical protein
MRPASHMRAECDRVGELLFQPVNRAWLRHEEAIAKDQLAGRPVSSRVGLDRRGHGGQDTDTQVSHRSDANAEGEWPT